MSYKRVIQKKGKSYGPYIYESYRDANGVVRKRYLGKAKQKQGKHFLIAFIGLLFFLAIFLHSSYTTGFFLEGPYETQFFEGIYGDFLTGLSVSDSGSSDSGDSGGSDSGGDSGSGSDSEGSSGSSSSGSSDSSSGGSSDSSSSDSGSDSSSDSGAEGSSSDSGGASDSSSDSSGSESSESDGDSGSSDSSDLGSNGGPGSGSDSEEDSGSANDDSESVSDSSSDSGSATGDSSTEDSPSDSTENEDSSPEDTEGSESESGDTSESEDDSAGTEDTNDSEDAEENENSTENSTEPGSNSEGSSDSESGPETGSSAGGTGGGGPAGNTSTTQKNVTNGTLNDLNTSIEDEEQISNLTNQTILNISLSNNVSFGIGNASNLTDTTLNETTNITLGNLSEITNNATNVSVAKKEVVQYRAVIGRPVRWIRNVAENDSTEVTLPKEAQNITVLTGSEVEEALEEVVEYETLVEESDREDLSRGIITGQAFREVETGTGIFSGLLQWLRSFTISGRAISEEELESEIVETEEEIIVDVSEFKEEVETVAIEYYTEAPQARETNRTNNGKDISIYSTEEYNYTDILAFTFVEDGLVKVGSSDLLLYWHATTEDAVEYGYIEEETDLKEGYVAVAVTYDSFDLNEDGYIDYIEWIVPHLSEQNYSLIIRITSAQHLDTERNFISDIYDDVRELDGNWSEPIHTEEYVRITFEENLTSQRDITVYPRTINGTPRIEIYEINKTEIIAEFTSLNDNQLNKVYLTNLTGIQDSFDLRIFNGVVEFDYIVDPAQNVTACVELNVSGTTYVLQNNITTTGTCFNITADNIVLDGNGYTIDGDDGATDYGVIGDSRLNLTIKNFRNISDFNGAIYLPYTNNSKITNNTATSNANGLMFVESHNNIVTSNVFTASTAAGVYMLTGVNITVANNTVSDNTRAFHLLFTAVNNTLSNNDIFSNTYGFNFQTFSTGNTLESNNITNNFQEILDETGNSETNYFTYSNLFGKITWTDTANGGFLKDLDLTGDIGLGINLSIMSNSVDLTTAAFTAGSINSSANVTLYNVPTDFVNPEIRKDGQPCTDCHNFTSLTAGTVIFNVTSWSNYSIGGNNSAPVVFAVVVNATTTKNLSEENLTVYFDVNDSNGDLVYNVTDWRVNGDSIAVLNMPFNTNVTSGSNTVLGYTTGGNNGTLQGNTIWNASGKVGGSYSFDADGDYITLGNTTSFQNLQINMTILGWFKEDGTSLRPSIIGQYPGLGPGQLQKLVRLDSNTLNYFTTTPTSFQTQAMATTHPTDTWTFFAVRVNGSTSAPGLLMRLNETTEHYVLSAINATPSPAGDIVIGWVQSANADEDFGGQIDELMIFNRSLTEEQISAIYEAGLASHGARTIVSQETAVGENWTVAVTGSDTYNDSATVLSGQLTIRTNEGPVISDVLLNSTSGEHETTDNLTVVFNSSDLEGDTEYNTTDWRVGGDSIAVLNVPFNTNVSSASGAVLDYSTSSNNGTLMGGVTWNATGINGGGYAFDGDADYIEFGNETSFQSLQVGMTIVGWFMEDGSSANPTIFAQYKSTSAGQLPKMVRLDSDTVTYYTTTTNSFQGFSNSQTYALNQWHFFAVRVNGTLSNPGLLIRLNETTQHFIPSAMNETPDESIRIRVGWSEVEIGSEDFGGQIDDLIVFNRSLSEEQISAIYQAGLANRSLTTLVSQETQPGEGWTVAVGGTDTKNLSSTVLSNTVTISDTGSIVWNCSSAGTFDTPGCWTLGRVPATGDDVVFNASGNGAVNITNNTLPQNLNSFTVANDYGGSIRFLPLFAAGNWTGNNDGTPSWNVTKNITLNNATMYLYGDFLHENITGAHGNTTREGHGQIWTSTQGTISIGSTAVLDGVGLGFLEDVGPGSLDNGGACHAGYRINGTEDGFCRTKIYGNASAPTSLGTGSGNSTGGSAIQLVSTTKNISVLGLINMSGTSLVSGSGTLAAKTGAGGSVWLKADSINITGSVVAAGGDTNKTYAGTGGRIRLEYESSLSATGTVDVSGGSAHFTTPTYSSDPGTLTFTNNTWPGNWNITRSIGLLGGNFGDGAILQVQGNLDVHADVEIYGDFITANNYWNTTNEGLGVWINSSGNITIAKGATMDGSGNGFLAGKGPSPGNISVGASHGGFGAARSTGTYGNETAPLSLGSGGTAFEGGSAIKLEAAEHVRTSGQVNMTGFFDNNQSLFSKSSGGSIFFDAPTIYINGTLSVIQPFNGAGGRLALVGSNITIESGSLDSYTLGSSDGGSIYLNASTILHSIGASSIHAYTTSGNRGGNITLAGNQTTLSGNVSSYANGNITVYYEDCKLSDLSAASFDPEPGIVAGSCDRTKPTVSFVQPSYFTGMATRELFGINTSSNDENNVSVLVDVGNTSLGWWTMGDVRGNILVDQFGKTNGTITGMATEIANGKLGSAMSFSGDGEINVSTLFGNKAAFTIAAWVKSSTVGRIISTKEEVIPFFDDFSTDKGWTTYGGLAEWERAVAGTPTLCAGGSLDPSADRSPSSDGYLIGNDIGDCYSDGLEATYYLTSPSINCTNCVETNFSFWRHLGVESSDDVNIDVYNGSDWVEIFSNTGTITDTTWNLQSYNISNLSNGNSNLSIRFGMGLTDLSNAYSGWNIDDVRIAYENPSFSGQEIYLSTENGGEFVVEDPTFGDSKVTYSFASFNDSKWHHIMGTWAVTETMSLFIDGVHVNTTSSGGFGSMPNDEIYIGSEFYGEIDDVVTTISTEVGGADALALNASGNATVLFVNSSRTDRNTYIAYAQDLYGNINATSIWIFYRDLDKPHLANFVGSTPANATYWPNQTFPVNTSVNDTMTNVSIFFNLDADTLGWWRMETFVNDTLEKVSSACYDDTGGTHDIEISAGTEGATGHRMLFETGPDAGNSYTVASCSAGECGGGGGGGTQCCRLTGWSGCTGGGYNSTYDYNLTLVRGSFIENYFPRTNASTNVFLEDFNSSLLGGRWGNATNLTGRSLILQDYSWPSTEPFAIAAWVWPDSFTDSGSIISKSSDVEYSLHVGSGNDIVFEYWNSTGDSVLNLSSPDSLTQSRWHLVAITYNGSYGQLFVDNDLVANQTIGSAVSFNNTGVETVIGSGYYNTSSTAAFRGLIDNVMIFNRSFSTNEILGLYNNNSRRDVATTLSDIGIGNHTYSVYVEDLAGNINVSEERELYVNLAPNAPSITINSTLGLNRTAEDLNCFFTVSDTESDAMSVTISWVQEGQEPNITYQQNYTNQTNGTVLISTLNSGNTSKSGANSQYYCNVSVSDEYSSDVWSSSSTLQVLNTPPVVTLTSPTDGNATTDRQPTFTWSVNDDDGDTYQSHWAINEVKFSGSKVCSDSQAFGNLSENTHSPVGDLQCLHDNGYYYNWSVRAHDGETYGDYAMHILNITALISHNVTTSLVDFGGLASGGTNDTTNDSPPPFVIENNGNAYANISANSSAFWKTVTTTSDNYQFKVDNVSGEGGSFHWASSLTDWTNMSITGAVVAISHLYYGDSTDSAEIDLRVQVPGEESGGSKGATVVFVSELDE